MRITETQMQNSILNGLFKRVDELAKAEEALTTGKRVNKPSDDPSGMAKISSYKTLIAKTEQFGRNMDFGSGNMKVADSALISVHDLLGRAREVAIQQATGTSTAETRAAAAQEIDQIKAQILGLANSKLGSTYIFGGYKNATQPFDATGAYVSDSNTVQVEIEPNTYAQTNIPGDAVFNGAGVAGGDDIFDTLQGLSDAMNANDPATINASIDRINATFKQVESAQATVGAVTNLFEGCRTRVDDKVLNIKTLLSKTEDLDLAKAISDFSVKQSALEAARAVAAKMMGNSLLDYLR